MLEQLGEQMVIAGKNTDAVATQFAAAKAGYTDFEKAVGEGKATEMAQNRYNHLFTKLFKHFHV